MTTTINAKSTGIGGLDVTCDASGSLGLQTGGTTAVTIDTSQNVGIGTTSPTSILDIRTSNPTRGIITSIVNTATSSQTGAQIRLTQNGIEDWVIGQPAAANAFAIWSGRSAGADGTERMRIDSSGNVGIGTASPSQRLESYVTSSTEGTGLAVTNANGGGYGSGLSFYSVASDSTKLMAGQVGMIGSTSWSNTANASSHMLFKTINSGTLAERMRIASNGQMLLGTTTNSGRSPPLIISNDSGTTNWAVGPSSGGSTQFYVSAGAGVYLSSTSATSWTANSDERLKNITGKIENALDAISTLTPAKFTWKSDEENTPQIGLIAQEVEKVLPEVVDKNADGYLGVRYTETIPLLVAAIQEQQTIINDLKARIETLESK